MNPSANIIKNKNNILKIKIIIYSIYSINILYSYKDENNEKI
jgi:hypothetical protein